MSSQTGRLTAFLTGLPSTVSDAREERVTVLIEEYESDRGNWAVGGELLIDIVGPPVIPSGAKRSRGISTPIAARPTPPGLDSDTLTTPTLRTSVR